VRTEAEKNSRKICRECLMDEELKEVL
jgi:hypothetical protein